MIGTPTNTLTQASQMPPFGAPRWSRGRHNADDAAFETGFARGRLSVAAQFPSAALFTLYAKPGCCRDDLGALWDWDDCRRWRGGAGVGEATLIVAMTNRV
ncbi:uncharacterized protein PG986_010369 [Apiospora aurea]|uniref:Uncharacterized protein n=1 Tax=Apiospora aurea TaxID=335848 RepID=A0ABR1Q206_9PEZI